jgi:hypothetical protein
MCRNGGMVDTRDSKSRDSDIVSVQVRFPVPFFMVYLFLIIIFSPLLTQESHDSSQNPIDVIHIMIHGTADGVHLYSSNFGKSGSFKGFTNNIRSQFMGIFRKSSNKELYHDIFKFGAYKERMKILLTDGNLPLIMGTYPGLSEISSFFTSSQTEEEQRSSISKRAYNDVFSLFKKNIEKQDPQSNHGYYMFNWVGNLSSYDRTLASERLADDLATFIEKNPTVKINIYGHSHGGNVILEALALLSEQKKNILINNICLLGTPIGKKTHKYVRKLRNVYCIYNFYSLEDQIQNKDITFDPFIFKNGRRLDISNISIHNIQVVRNDKETLHHGMLYIAHNKGLKYPVLCEIPLLLGLIKEKENKTISLKEYTYYTQISKK